MTYLNAHERMGVRIVYWNQWKAGDILEFELVDYFNSPIIREGNGLYHVYYAIAKADYEFLGINEGDPLELHITYRSYKKSISSLPNAMIIPCKKEYAKGKNLYIKLEKVNSRIIKVHYQEPREPTLEQLKEASIQYNLLK